MDWISSSQEYIVSVRGNNQGKRNQTKTLRYYKMICSILLVITLIITINFIAYYIKTVASNSAKTILLEKELDSVKTQLLQGEQSIIEPNGKNDALTEMNQEINKLNLELKEVRDKLEKALQRKPIFYPKKLELIKENDMPFINSLFPNSIIKLIPLYKASTDGDSLHQFKLHLQNVPSLLFVIQAYDGITIGGYVQNVCDPNLINTGYIVKEDKTAFLFSITNQRKYPVKNYNGAIYCNDRYLMAFNKDLMIVNNCLSQSSLSEFPKAYTDIDNENKSLDLTCGAPNITIIEMEVYKVIVSDSN